MSLNLSELTIADLSSYYQKYKAAIDFKKTSIKDLEDKQNEIIAEIDIRMKKEGQTSCKTENGLFYYMTKTRVTKKDGDAFLKFAQENGRFDLLNIQPLKTACLEYIQSTDLVPPGVEYQSFKEVAFRKG